MSMLSRLIQAVQPIFRSQKDLNDQYLAEAVSVYDLERRMHEIELHAPVGFAALGSR